jgi:hypothetical protein
MLKFKRKSKSPRSKLIAKADELFSKLVRARDGRCQWPGCQSTTIYTHHIFSRRYLQTRWDMENGISLCVYHHTLKAHGDPEEFRDFILKRMGNQRFMALKARAYGRAVPVTVQDIEMILLGLKEAINEANETE